MSGQQRVADYFIVAGLPDHPVPLDDGANDSPLKPTSKNEPITDVCVIIPNDGEECPPGYKPLLSTPSGIIADLNHGSIRSPEVFICFRRGRDKSPLTDIGVLYEGSERVLPGCEVVYTTPYGRPANINNTASRIYLTYRRASETASSDTLAVTDICVINTSKGEKAPHSFCRIDKNLNQAMMSSSIYLCYKKSMRKDYSIAYTPGVLSRYPAWDWPDFPLPEDSIAMFGLPMGAMLESWPEKAAQAKSVFATFVLTGLDGRKVYGAAVTFYELFTNVEGLSEAQKKSLGLHLKKKRLVHVNKAICVLAKRPFFFAFKKFLQFIYRETLSNTPRDIPIERLISHFMWDVPFPSPERPSVLAQFSDNCTVEITLPDESPIPLSGASFSNMLRNLGVENTVNLLTMTLLEKKLLIHSLRPAVVTGVIEAVGSMIFPFSWQCPYIPLCPLGITEVLFAPVPYIVGVDSRYFDLYDPPPDVTCIDLDTNTISKPSDTKLLPKRPTKVLKATLEKLYYQIQTEHQGAAAGNEKQIAAENTVDTLIQEAFLRFMASILKGYKNFLLPITSAPSDSSTSVKELFDLKAFLKSRDKAYHKLYEQVVRTQAFTRFIEERSFNIRDDTSLLFFDECTENVDENYDTPKLLETDAYKSEHTVFVSPPQPAERQDPPVTYAYDRFPSKLNPNLFPQRDHHVSLELGVDINTTSADSKTFTARRSKAETKAALKLASMSKKGIAASTLWAKCLVNNTFSLWFAHLPSFIQTSQSPDCAMRVACAILKKMQEYRLHTPDELCYRTVMQLCGIHNLPVLAVKVLCEMKSIGLNANAVTYGYYNKAILESKWPSELTTAQAKWRIVRHLITGVAQFKQALRNRRRSIDGDSISRGSGSGTSSEVTLDIADYPPTKTSRKEDVISIGTADVGYSSMSQEDIQKYTAKMNTNAHNASAANALENDAFRAKVGSIIRRSMSREAGDGHNITGSYLQSSAGLLITARRVVRRVPLGGSLSPTHSSAFAEAKRKRHKSAGDHLRRSYQPTATRLGGKDIEEVDSNGSEGNANVAPLETLVDSRVPTLPGQTLIDIDSTASTSSLLDTNPLVDLDMTTHSQPSPLDNIVDPLTGATTTKQSTRSTFNQTQSSAESKSKTPAPIDDPLGLFSAGSPDLKRSTPKTEDLLDLSGPASGMNPSLTTMDIGNLFGRDSSPKKTASDNTNDGFKKYNLLQLSPEKETATDFQTPQLRKSVSLDSRSSYRAALREDDARSADAVLSVNESEQSKEKDSIGSKESLGSVGSADATPIVANGTTPTPSPSYKDWMRASIKKSANLTMKVKSMVYGADQPKLEPYGAMSSHESLDSIGATPKPIKRNDDMKTSLKKIKSVSSSMASRLYSNYKQLKHTVKEYQAPSTVSTPYKEDKFADKNNDDNISVLSSHSGLGLPNSGAEESTAALEEGSKPFDTTISYAGISPAFIGRFMPSAKQSEYDTVDDAFTFSNVPRPPVLAVVMCSATLCLHCSLILYDEVIMAGWSAQDSELNTVCGFCEKKQVPFLHIDMKDLRIKPHSSRQSVSTDEGFMSSPPLTPRSDASNAPESIKLPYLSPLVLRKELERVLEREGDVTLTSPDFVDNHAIIYWNLMWYFKRLNVPSHLPQLLFHSKTLQLKDFGLKNPQPSDMTLRVVWDNPKLHDTMVTPMYKLWNDSGVKSTVVRALLTDEMAKSRSFMQQILTYVECNDLYTALRQVLNNRRALSSSSTLRFQSAYRDILFLAFVRFGREVMDHDAFDREYKLAFNKLSTADTEYLQKADNPPLAGVMWCRKLFGNLDVV